MDPSLEVRVEFYSGAAYAERPRVIHWGKELYTVDKVIDRWRTPDEIGFIVRTMDEKLIKIHTTGETDCWQACFYHR
jgi:hypothetical protein